MAITKYGVTVVLWCFCIVAVLALLAMTVIENDISRNIIVGVLMVFFGLVLNFFRDPLRKVPDEKNAVISPADGKIVLIKELFEPEFHKNDAVQVSIFMSPLNVHVNRFPISGAVEYFRHIHGEYLVAFDDKSSERNERTLIGVNDHGWKVLFKQIAGTVARRIIADVTVGQQATAGEKFGMIRFGSRVDVIMPRGTGILVSLGQHVVAGETVLARYGKAGNSGVRNG